MSSRCRDLPPSPAVAGAEPMTKLLHGAWGVSKWCGPRSRCDARASPDHTLRNDNDGIQAATQKCRIAPPEPSAFCSEGTFSDNLLLDNEPGMTRLRSDNPETLRRKEVERQRSRLEALGQPRLQMMLIVHWPGRLPQTIDTRRPRVGQAAVGIDQSVSSTPTCDTREGQGEWQTALLGKLKLVCLPSGGRPPPGGRPSACGRSIRHTCGVVPWHPAGPAPPAPCCKSPAPERQ